MFITATLKGVNNVRKIRKMNLNFKQIYYENINI